MTNQSFITVLCLAALAASTTTTSAFTTPATFTRRPAAATPTQLAESFGLNDIALDNYEAQPDFLKGEAEYKQWMNKIDDNNFLNRKYNVVGRVRELNLLKATLDAGLLSKLEDNGLDLATIEKLLPLADELGLLAVAGNNQQLLVNGLAPLLIEGAPFLLPVVANALAIGPSAFFGGAAAAGLLEVYLLANDVEVLNLSAGVVAGLLLVPLTVVLASAGVALNNLKKAA